MIDRLMRQLNWTPADLQHLYVSQGPGSFTGLRIGITLAKTLAFATGARIVAVPTLQVLAENAPAEAGHLIVLLDAKRDQIFTARYERVGNRWHEIEPAHLDSLTAMIERSPRPVHLLGEGIPFHKHFLSADASGILLTGPDCWRARASVVARIGMELAKLGAFVAPDQLIPAYVRKPEAEEKYELEHGHGR